MKTGYYRTAILVVAVAVALSAQALAQPGGWGRGPWQGRPGGPGMMRGARPFGGSGPWGAALHRLDLSQEQREKIRDIMADSRTDARSAREALADAQRAFRDAVAEGAGEEQIHAAAEKLAQAVAGEAVLRARTMQSVKEVLTEQQLEQIERFKERAGQLRQRMRPGQGPGRRQLGGGNRMGPQAQRGGRMQPPGRQGPPSSGNRGRFDDGRGPRSWSGGRGRTDTRRPMDAPGPQGRGPLPLDRMFEKADTNEDGLLSRAEIEALRGDVPDRPGFRGR